MQSRFFTEINYSQITLKYIFFYISHDKTYTINFQLSPNLQAHFALISYISFLL
jgi:hypothetical protein